MLKYCFSNSGIGAILIAETAKFQFSPHLQKKKS